MPDRPESIPPPVPSHLKWEEDVAFRHVFLFRFDEPDRATLRRLGEMLYRYVLETAVEYGPDLQGAAPIAAELAAAAADLRVLWGFFRMLEVEGQGAHRGRSGALLTDLAGTLANEMTRLAGFLEGELS
jgi:hypothetical protein